MQSCKESGVDVGIVGYERVYECLQLGIVGAFAVGRSCCM